MQNKVLPIHFCSSRLQQQIEDHRVILVASSPFFPTIFQNGALLSDVAGRVHHRAPAEKKKTQCGLVQLSLRGFSCMCIYIYMYIFKIGFGPRPVFIGSLHQSQLASILRTRSICSFSAVGTSVHTCSGKVFTPTNRSEDVSEGVKCDDDMV